MHALTDWLAGHKKLTVTLLGALASMIPASVLDDDSKTKLIGVLMAYLVGQGVADHGKEAAKIVAAGKP
jgi:hypothetical protein